MAKTKNQEGTCSTPVKGQVNHSNLDKNQGSQQCDSEEHLTILTKRGNATVSSSKFGKRSRSSSPRQQDSSPRRGPKTVVPQEQAHQTEFSVGVPLHQVTDHLLQKTTTPSPKGRRKKVAHGEVSKASSNEQDTSTKPRSKTASPSLNFDTLPERKSADGTVQDQSRIFVYQNVKHAISGLPAGTKTPEGTSTPIVYIRDVLQGEEETSVAGSGTISGCELKRHLLKSFSNLTDMANEEPSLVGNKKKVSPKKGPMQTPAKMENHGLAKNVSEKPSKTKNVPKSLIKDNLEKKENLKGNSMLLKECPSETPSIGVKQSPTLDQVEKVKSKKKRRSPSSAIPVENKNLVDTVTLETRLPADLGPVEITLNNGDQVPMDTESEEMSGSHPSSTSPTPPRDGDVRHGRRIRSPSVRYADDMILFPLKSPRKSPKLGNSRDGGSPEDRQVLEKDKPFKLVEGEKLTKTAECQTSELYALLTRTLTNDKIITPSRRKSPVETAMVSDSSMTVKKHTGAVREINFSEGMKTNTRDSQIQVQMEEHLANVHKEELSRLKQELPPDTKNVASPSTSAVASYNKDNISKGDSRQSANITLDNRKQNSLKQKSANKNISKQSSSKVSDPKQKSPVKKDSKQSVSKQTDSKQRSLLKSNKIQSISKSTDLQQTVSMPTVSKQSVPMQSDSKQCDSKYKQSSKHECEKTDTEQFDSIQGNSEQVGFKQKKSNKSVPKQSVSKQSESRQLDSKQGDFKGNDSKRKSANKSVSQEIDSKEGCSSKTESKTKEGCSSKTESKTMKEKTDSKHKSKAKNSSKQMDDSKSDLRKDNSKPKSNVKDDTEHLSEHKNDLKQNRNNKSSSVEFQCDNVEPDLKRNCKTAVKTDSKRSSSVKCEPQQGGRVKGSPGKKDSGRDSKNNGDKISGKVIGASDIKIESEEKTDHNKIDKSCNDETDAEEKCGKKHIGDATDSVEKSDSFVSQKPKSSNLFSLISRVKSNLECPNPLTEFLNSPLYEPPTSGDEEEDISDESFTASDKDNTQLLEESSLSADKENNISASDKLLKEISDNEAEMAAGSFTAKDTSTEKQPQWRKNDQDKNSLEDLLNSDGQSEDHKSRDRATKRSPEKNQSPGRITRSHTSPEKPSSQTRLPKRNNSPDKNTIYPADVILIDTATSSSDNVNSASSSSGKKTVGNIDDNQSMVVSSTDADSTTDDSPNRKNIFDLLMCSYEGEKGDQEGKEDEEGQTEKEGKEEKVTGVLEQQNTNGSEEEKLAPNAGSESDNRNSKKELDSDRNKKDVEVIDSNKKVSKVSLDPVDTVDLTCDENGFDSVSDTVQQEQTGMVASPMIGHTGSALKTDLTASTASTMQRSQSGSAGHDTPDHPKISEPRPLDVLKNLEMDTTDKMSAFQSKSLDEYLRKMKKQDTPVEQNNDTDDEEEDDEEDDEDEEHEDEEDDEEEDEDEEAREFEEELEPDFDEVDGMVFVSFPSEETLSAHIEVEQKTRIGKNENLLLGISRLRNLRKKRDHMQLKYNKRIHRLKALKAQGQMNQNLRGMHKALEKYQKLYRTELYMILKSKNKDVNFKSPQKTSDITKIKGWKKKFGNAEQMAEATGLPISQTGKLHWRTEARLLKNLKPDELKEIGLNLKKKRRKNLVFTIRKGMSKGDNRPDRNEDGAEEYEDVEGEDHDDDFYDRNEDDFRDEDADLNRDDSWFVDFSISPEKEKKSQYMKKQERLKKRLMLQSLSFGPEEETIIRKLGGQRSLRKSILGLTSDDRAPALEEVMKGKRGRKRKGEAMTLTTVSQSMALKALATLDQRFVKEKPKPSPPLLKEVPPVKKEVPPAKKEVPPVKKEVPPVKKEVSDRLGLQEDQNLDNDWLPPEVNKEKKRGRKKKRKFPQKRKQENEVQCDQPGCRYGCICHLCKFAESGPDSDSRPSQVTPCDKEYCRLGCICDSLMARGHDPMVECQKPECQQGCLCVKEEQGEATEEEKQQRQKAVQKRFEALPRRQSTYRLAKNLDAVSRKAMLYYESSEMYCTEQSTRKRKSKETDDLPKEQNRTVCHIPGPAPPVSVPVTSLTPYPVSAVANTAVLAPTHVPVPSGIQVVPPPTAAMDAKMSRYVITAGQIKSSNANGVAIPDDSKNTKPAPKPSKQTGRKDPPWYPSNKSRKKDEIGVRRTEFDDITFDEMLESDSEDSLEFNTCARTVPYYNSTRRNKQRCTCHADNCTQGSASCQGAQKSKTNDSKAKEVGDPSSPIVISPGNTPPSSPSSQSLNLTRLPDRMGYNGSKNIPAMGARKSIHTGWHTQWVCLKTSKKKPEEEEESYEIRLLEMISNCNWENAKQKILSKISNQISREHYPNPRQMIVGDFCISFLPRSDKPAVIPPEVKAKLPKSIFSIRIKVEKRSHVLKARLGEFITEQEKILKPSLQSQDVITLDPPPTTTTTSSSLMSGGISGLSHLQINRHTTPSTLKWIPVSNTVGKTVTSPSQVSPHVVSSPSSALLKPGMCSKVSAPPPVNVGNNQPNNLVILQNSGGQKYVLAPSVNQPNLQLVPPLNTSSTIVSSSVSQNINRGASSAVSISTSSATVISSSVPVMISNMVTTKSASLPTPSVSSGIPVVISSVTPTMNPSVQTSTSNVPVANIGIPLMNSSQVSTKMSGIPIVNPGVPRAVSPANSGVTQFTPNMPQPNCSKAGTSVTCPNVINMTFTLPGKSTSHSTVTTHSVPVTLLASTQAVTMVTMATSASPASSVKGVLSPMPGSMLAKQSGHGLHPGVKVQGVIGDNIITPANPGLMSKLVPIVPKLNKDMILIPIPAPSSSRFNVPSTSGSQSKMTTAQSRKVQQIFNASRDGPGKNEASQPMVVVKEMGLAPKDKKLITTNTMERRDVVFHTFLMGQPQASPVEGEIKQGKKRKKGSKDVDNNEETEGDTEDKKKKKKKKKKPKPAEGDEGETKSQEEGKKGAKKRKKKKETNEISSESLIQNEKLENVADTADRLSPPTKKCRNDSTGEGQVTCNSVKDVEKNTSEGKSDVMFGDIKTSTKCGEVSGTNSNIVTNSNSICDKNSPMEMKCLKDTVTSSDSFESTGPKSKKETDSTCHENKLVTPDLHSVLFSQIENSIREYDGQDEPKIVDITKTSEHVSTTGQSESLISGKSNNSTTLVLDTPVVCTSGDIGNLSNNLSSEFSDNKSYGILPKDNRDILDKVASQSNVSSKDNLTNQSVGEMPLASDQDVTLIPDSPSQFEMDTESSEGDRQSCETSQNSLNDLKMLATVQKASVDVLQIIEGSKNPEGARHPLMPIAVSSEEEENANSTDNQISQRRVTMADNNSTGNGKVEKLVGKSVDIVNSIRHHIDLCQDKMREVKMQAVDSARLEDKTEDESGIEDGTWESRIGHEGCDDLVINLSDDESSSPEARNPVRDGVVSTSEVGTSHLKHKKVRTSSEPVVRTASEPVSVIVIDDEDKPSNTPNKQQVTTSSNVRPNIVTSLASDEVDITTVSDKEQNDDSDIDIENASDEESGSKQLQSYLMKKVRPTQQPSACSIHSHKGKRKASLDTIDNMLIHSVEFKEGLVKSSKKTDGNKKEKNTKHNSMEKQRRRELKNGFKDLIEVIFGQDESGQKKPLSVEAIQGASKIKVLHMALNMIKENIEKDVQLNSKIAALRLQKNALLMRLNRSRCDLINSGMPPVKIQDILNKISKTCQFIFAKREMLMKKRMDTLKTALDTCATSDDKAEEKVQPPDPKAFAKRKKTQSKPNPKSKSVQQQIPLPKLTQFKGKSVTPILPKSVPYTAVPVQLVSTEQVLQMAQINQCSKPEIYIDNAEDRGISIKEELLSEDEYTQDPPLQSANSWPQQETTRQGVNNSVNENNARFMVSSSSASNQGKEKEDEEELDRMNTQSPVFSDVDISENYFQQDDEDENMEAGADDPLTSSHGSSDMEYKVIDTSSHSEVMVGYIPEDTGQPSQDGEKPPCDIGKSEKDSNSPSVGVS